jgi:hypothetical protein
VWYSFPKGRGFRPTPGRVFIERFRHRLIQTNSPRRRKDELRVFIECVFILRTSKNLSRKGVVAKFEARRQLIESITCHAFPERQRIPHWYGLRLWTVSHKSFRAYCGFNDIHLQRHRQTLASPTVVRLKPRFSSLAFHAGTTSFSIHSCGKKKSANHSASCTDCSAW